MSSDDVVVISFFAGLVAPLLIIFLAISWPGLRRARRLPYALCVILLGGGSLLLVAFVTLLLGAWQGWLPFELGLPWTLFMATGVPLLSVLLPGIYLSSRSVLAERRLGRVQFKVGRLGYAGEGLPCDLRIVPRGETQLNRITVDLFATLTTVHRSMRGGRSSRTETRELYRSSWALFRGGSLGGEEPFEDRFNLPIPGNASPSSKWNFMRGWGSQRDTVEWAVALHIDVSRYPDWVVEERIRILEAREQPGPEPRERVPAEAITVSVQDDQTCPYCHDTVGELAPAVLITCAGCKTVYHKECLLEFDSCATRGCRNRRETPKSD